MQVLRELRTLQTRPRVIMLLDDDQSELVVESFRNGARGIFCRTEVTTQLRKCIQCVYKGQIWANNTQLEHIVEALMQAPAPMLAEKRDKTLSKREEEIARLVASGLSNGEVAQRLSLSRHTVKNYLFRVYEKLGISTRIELVLYILSQYNGPESEQNEIAEEFESECIDELRAVSAGFCVIANLSAFMRRSCACAQQSRFRAVRTGWSPRNHCSDRTCHARHFAFGLQPQMLRGIAF